MELIKLSINKLSDSYSIDIVEKEFSKAVNEKWKKDPPWQRYQRRLLQDLAILEEQKFNAIGLEGFEKLETNSDLYSIRHPQTAKNVRVLFSFYEGSIVLLKAFLEKTNGDYKRAIKTAENRLRLLKMD